MCMIDDRGSTQYLYATHPIVIWHYLAISPPSTMQQSSISLVSLSLIKLLIDWICSIEQVDASGGYLDSQIHDNQPSAEYKGI